MALVQPPDNSTRKRVKVYELKNNDWFDRGTGFCMGQLINEESRIYVESEDDPERILLETKISKDDGYQKQQETLIVWTESNGTDMALSFQEAEGCAAIWEFVSSVQQQLLALAGPDDALSDDAIENFAQSVLLPQPQLNNLHEIDQMMRAASQSPQGRDALGKFVLQEDYVRHITPLVELAEDLEDLPSLHRLSSIMKTFILLNDTQIIEHMMSDGIVDGVVGALEYDQEFPQHKANHREYLQNKSRFKEVVPIQDPTVKKKIHATWRLQYLKDVVLARILDDPTFSVLNSLIFFNQVDIVSHLQANSAFIKDLFSLVDDPATPAPQRKDAICFIQQCCAIAKNLQAPARAGLYQNFIQNGLLNIIVLALAQSEAAIRVAATDILVALIDHDPSMVRSHVFKAMSENTTPLTDTLVELLLVEEDLGVKAQAADAIKILLDPQQNAPPDGMARMGEQFIAKYRQNPGINQQTENFIQDFYDNGARKLFAPLKVLEQRETLADLTFNEQSLYLLLVEILMYFVRQHFHRSKFFIDSEAISARIAQLLKAPQKHLKLTALKFFRACLGLQDEFYYKQLIKHNVFEPIFDIVQETLSRENLLNSACLELFEFVRREQVKPIIVHVVEAYRSRVEALADMELFELYLVRYDQMQQGYEGGVDANIFAVDEANEKAKIAMNGHGGRWHGATDITAAEEDYFNTSDDEDELAANAAPLPKPHAGVVVNGASPLMKPLVDYPDDEDEGAEEGDMQAFYDAPDGHHEADGVADADASNDAEPTAAAVAAAPPERLAEKRRREEDDDEDELGKLTVTKRRTSASGLPNALPKTTEVGGKTLRRRPNLAAHKDGAGAKKISISLGAKAAAATATTTAEIEPPGVEDGGVD